MQKTLRGGTLIGFVVGLLVGLGLALAVAIYVTKVPVPFVDRGISRKPTQDAIEAERNRNWNPNATITGNKPAAPAAAPASEDAPAISAPGAATPTANAPATPPKPTADPLGDLMRERTQQAPAGKDPFVYFVQAGAFRTQADADAQKARLAMLGLDARVTEREQAGQTVFRVRMGPFDAKTDAEATQAKLIANSQEAALVRVQR
jgi:cell division protein FtsN